MSKRKTPRRPRWAPSVNTLKAAKARAAKLTKQEVETLTASMRNAMVAMREGRANLRDWIELACACTVAQCIEARGVVRGLSEHLNLASKALESIYARASQTADWTPTALYFHELDALDTLASLFAYQLSQLSGAEYEHAHRAALSRGIQTGGPFGDACRQSQTRLAAYEKAARSAST